MSDTLKLEAIRARANAATPGPWYANGAGEIATWLGGERRLGDVVASDGEGFGVCTAQDECFIAHARADIPALLDRIAGLEEQHAAALAIVRAVAEAEVISTDSLNERWGSLSLPYPARWQEQARALLAGETPASANDTDNDTTWECTTCGLLMRRPEIAAHTNATGHEYFRPFRVETTREETGE